MSNHRPKYQYIDRVELNELMDELMKTREEIRKVFTTPVTKISNERKYFVLQDLDERETYWIRELARLKGILQPSDN